MPRFDTFPILYLFPVYGLCWGLLWLTVRGDLSRWLFLTGALGLLLLLRLPSIVYNAEINPDESQMITQALTLRHDPVYFRSVDGTTGGPLDSYFLILPTFLGLPFDYITAHLTAFVLVALCLGLSFRTAALWFGEEPARLALLPLIFTFGLTQNGDFLHYNSELIALALLNVCYYGYARLERQPIPSVGQIAGIGFLLGSVPFCKLQAVPLVAVVGLFVAIDVLTRRNLTRLDAVKRVVVLVGSGLLFPLIVVGLTRLNGVYDDFVLYYLLANLRYAGGGDPWQNLLLLPAFFRKGNEFEWLVWLSGLVWIACLLTVFRRKAGLKQVGLRTGAFIGTLLVATLFAITRTGSNYVHYLYLLTNPLLFGLAYGWQQIRAGVRVEPARWLSGGILASFLALFGGHMLAQYRQGKALNPYPSDKQNGWAIQPSPVSTAVLNWARPGEKLVVWGWRCDYYVQTQMPQGVAENHTIRSAFTHPLQAAYQQRYVRNFVQSFPPVFVDAVGGQNLWMTDRRRQGHEVIQPLNQFVAAHYHYVGLVSDARIYVRRDRIRNRSAEHKLACLTNFR